VKPEINKPQIKAVETVAEDAARDEEPGAETAAPLTAVHSFAEKIGSRNLMIAIVTMPFFFIGVLALIIAAVGLPEDEADLAGTSLETPVGAPLEAAVPDAATLGDTVGGAPAAASSILPGTPAAIPPGGVALDGDRLAVRIEGPDGPVVVIYDLSRGAVTHEIPLAALGDAR